MNVSFLQKKKCYFGNEKISIVILASYWPVMEQRSLNDLGGGDPLEYSLSIPLPAAWGNGIESVIALWNFLLRGSTVTIGDTATRLPNNLAVNSEDIGWA